MKRSNRNGCVALTICLCILATGCDVVESASRPDLAAIEQAIADSSRISEQIDRDVGRKPFEVLSLSNITQGDRVLELAPGSGYYTALLSRIVGDTGRVVAVDPRLIFDEFPGAIETFPKFMEADPLNNVDYSIQRFDELEVAGSIDVALMILYYHDTVWTGEDRSAMNAAIYDALVPGGTYLVIDHHAVSGAGDSVTRELHRMDVAQVIPEITSVGFELVTNSDVLRNNSDPRDVSVFLPEWRGKTDRFMFLFRKPK